MTFIIFISCIGIFLLPSILRKKYILSAAMNVVFLTIYISYVIFKDGRFGGFGGFNRDNMVTIFIVPWILGNFFKKEWTKWNDI